MAALVGDRYEIVRELDRGGMGEVLLARQINLGRLVVIKRVLAEHANDFVAALREEALLAARLNHPNIVGVLDVSEPDEPAFVAMEYVAGVSLREMIKVAPKGLPADVALAIALDVLRGLAYAHEVRSGDRVGVVHRDIKPRNIMVTFAGVTKLIDFGISRWLHGDGKYEATSVAGTYGYMAPEQLLRKPVDGRADQYALAVTLREMLTGLPPDDQAPDEPPTRGRAKPPPIATARSIEPELAEIVDRAAAEDAAARFPNCEALAEALAAYAKEHDLDPSAMCVEKWLEQNLADRIAAAEREAARASEPALAATVPAPPDAHPTMDHRKGRAPSAKTVAERTPAGEQFDSQRTPPRKRRRWPIVVALAACAIAGVAVYLATRSPPPPLVPVVERAAGGPLRIDVVATGAERDLGIAIRNITRRALRDAPERRFWVSRETDPTAKQIEIRFELAPTGIHLAAHDGATRLASADAASIYEAVEQLAPPLAKALGSGRADPGPDADERERMTKLGARSFEQYRRYRKLAEEVRIPGWFDSGAAIKAFEAMVAEDPAWGHPYAELNWLHGRNTKEAKQILEEANRKVDPRRGAGLTLIRALDLETERTVAASKRAIAMLDPVVRANPDDLLAGEVLSAAYSIAGRHDEAFAIIRLQFDREPWLFYGGDVVDDLIKQGREAEALKLLDETLGSRVPESLTGWRARIKLQALSMTPDDPSPARSLERMRLIHGERPLVIVELYEAMIAAGDLSGARRLADRMLAGSGLSQVRGRYRTAVIALFEGRFAAAYEMAKRAYEDAEPFGSEGELYQAFQLLVSVGPNVGQTDATIAALEKRAAVDEGKAGYELPVAWMRYAAARLKTRCPSIDAALGKLTGDTRAAALKLLRRAAAQVGCVKCEEVVADGLSATEINAEQLLAFGRCARVTGQLDLAIRAFERAAAMWSSWNNRFASPYHAISAWYELGLAHKARGNDATARVAWQRFLRAWGKADRALPEVADAQRAVTAK